MVASRPLGSWTEARRAGPPDAGAEARTMGSPVSGPRPKTFIFSVEIELMRKLEASSPAPAKTWLGTASAAPAHHRHLARGARPQEDCGSPAVKPATVKPAPRLCRLGEMPASVVPRGPQSQPNTEPARMRSEQPHLSGVTEPVASPFQKAPGNRTSAGAASEQPGYCPKCQHASVMPCSEPPCSN